jgi:hypothetical protein
VPASTISSSTTTTTTIIWRTLLLDYLSFRRCHLVSCIVMHTLLALSCHGPGCSFVVGQLPAWPFCSNDHRVSPHPGDPLTASASASGPSRLPAAPVLNRARFPNNRGTLPNQDADERSLVVVVGAL